METDQAPTSIELRPAPKASRIDFTGLRGELAGILLRGYLLMIPTLGIYRFWLVTQKRRFYWSHTKIDGERLEYTGTAKQIFIGFLIAVAVLLPLYVLVFYAGTQSPEIAMLAIAFAAVLVFFLIGYALYRARRFRLTRTLLRGIRFHQGGNAWHYAFRRFGWWILTIATLGLAYPFMAADLWRYRYNNSWYGDQKFTMTGTWRTIAKPYYILYLINFAIIAATIYWLSSNIQNIENVNPGFGLYFLIYLPFLMLPLALLFGIDFLYLKARVTSRMLSTVTLGEAKLRTRLKVRSLLGMYATYVVMLIGTSFVLGLIFFPLLLMIGGDFQPGGGQPLAATILGFVSYGAFLGLSSLIAELYLGLGYWKLLAMSSAIENADDLKNVKAMGEESSVLGEGLADALDVGAF